MNWGEEVGIVRPLPRYVDEAERSLGLSSFWADLDAEFQAKRECEQISFILTCTKMKNAKEPKPRAYEQQAEELPAAPETEGITGSDDSSWLFCSVCF